VGGMLDKIATSHLCGSKLLLLASPVQSWSHALVTMSCGRELWAN
jgi:hypothetical protein